MGKCSRCRVTLLVDGWKTCDSCRKWRQRAPASFDIDVVEPEAEPFPQPESKPFEIQIISPHEPIPSSRGSATVAVGDVHFPFHSKMALASALDLIYELQPKNVVQMGDLYDLYCHSKYPRSLNLMTPNDEMDLARAQAEWFWSEVRRLSPETSRYQLGDGNHDHRANKRALEYFAASEKWVEDGVKSLLTFDGVQLVYGEREDLVLDGVCYVHGWGQFGSHFKAMGMPTVIGHLHRGNITHESGSWEMCCGWLGNRDSKVFSYQGKKRADKTTLGLGIIDGLGPRFVPLVG